MEDSCFVKLAVHSGNSRMVADVFENEFLAAQACDELLTFVHADFQDKETGLSLQSSQQPEQLRVRGNLRVGTIDALCHDAGSKERPLDKVDPLRRSAQRQHAALMSPAGCTLRGSYGAVNGDRLIFAILKLNKAPLLGYTEVGTLGGG